MVRGVACLARDPGSNPVGPKVFSPWNYFIGGSGNSGTPEVAGGKQERDIRGLSQKVVDFLYNKKTIRSIATKCYM